MKKRIVITGASGFLGGHLVTQASVNWKIYAPYRNKTYYFPEVTWYTLDLTNFDAVRQYLRSINPDVILHTAALTNVDTAEKDPAVAFLNNVLVTRNLADWCAEQRCRLIYVSSDMVFNGLRGNYAETDETDPLNYYGQTKLEGENYILRTAPDAAVVRSALIYGHSLTETRSFSEWMLLKWQQQQQVPLFVDQHRSPILVDNLAQALLELADSDFAGVLHLGGPDRINRLDFGIIFAKMLHIPAELILPTRMDDLPGAAPRPKDTSLNVTFARQVLKTPLVDCQQGIQYLKAKNWLVV